MSFYSSENFYSHGDEDEQNLQGIFFRKKTKNEFFFIDNRILRIFITKNIL